MKILLTATSLSPNYGGPAFSVSSLALALCSAGIEVGLWAQDNSVLTSELLPQKSPPGLVRLSSSAGDIVRQFRPDILHDNGLWLLHHHRLAIAAAADRIPRLVSTRGMLEPWARRHKKWKKDIAWMAYQHRDIKRVAALHATAASEADNIRRMKFGIPTFTIPNGVDLPDLSTGSRRIDPTERTALFLGRLYPVKGLPLLIEAWRQLRPKGWRLVLAGPDEAGHRAELEAQIAKANLGDCIEFAGPLSGADKSRAFFDADLFILPSHSESFGMALAEALAHGLPVLTTTSVPWPTLVERQCGWQVPPTIQGIVEGLRNATQQGPDSLKNMGRVGRELVTSEFGWSNIAARFVEAYRKILASGQGAELR